MIIPVQEYRVTKEIPRKFVHLLPWECSRIQPGEICHYFDSGNIYLFEAREHFVPWIERRYVELWTGEMFEPIDTHAQTGLPVPGKRMEPRVEAGDLGRPSQREPECLPEKAAPPERVKTEFPR